VNEGCKVGATGCACGSCVFGFGDLVKVSDFFGATISQLDIFEFPLKGRDHEQ
jgi:hypothetical protein